jgi:hypothetical protein
MHGRNSISLQVYRQNGRQPPLLLSEQLSLQMAKVHERRQVVENTMVGMSKCEPNNVEHHKCSRNRTQITGKRQKRKASSRQPKCIEGCRMKLENTSRK